MKNKKGFTIVELGVSIALVTVISLLLFQMIVSVKKLYTSNDVKTTLLTKQAIMVKKVYDEFDKKMVSEITNCDTWQNSCLKFIFVDGSTSTLLVNPIQQTLSYNGYTVDYEEIDDTVRFGDLTVGYHDDFFSIKVPVTSKTIEGDFGLTIIKQHANTVIKSFSTTYPAGIAINLYDDMNNQINTQIVNESSNYWLKIYDATDTNLNNLMSKNLKYLRLSACSVSDALLTGNVYELKTGANVSQWCQDNNFYNQNAKNYKRISGETHYALGKSTYVDALTTSGILNDTTLYLNVDEYMNLYTFEFIDLSS